MNILAPNNPILIYGALELQLTFPVLESLFRSLIISKIIHHPFSKVKREDCTPVVELALFFAFDDYGSNYAIVDKTIDKVSDEIFTGWRSVPRLGDMILFSGEAGVYRSGDIIPFMVRDTPIPLCGLEPIWIKTTITNVSYINLRFDLRTELLNWMSSYDL